MYLIDARPKDGKIELLLSGFKTLYVKTTFPVYLEVLPEGIFSHPSVSSIEEEEWRDLEGRRKKIYRVELRDYRDYLFFKKKLKVVNDFISPLDQALERLGLRPFSRVEVNNDKLVGKEEMDFPKVNYAKVVLYDWYGEHSKGRYYRLYYNGKLKEEGDVRDLEVVSDVVELPYTVYDKAKAIVKLYRKGRGHRWTSRG